MEKEVIFSVNLFCYKCWGEHLPNLSGGCIVYKPKKHRYFYIDFQNNLRILGPVVTGITPHVIELLEHKLNYVEYKVACGVCGFSVKRNSGSLEESYNLERISEEIIFENPEKWKKIYQRRIFR